MLDQIMEILTPRRMMTVGNLSLLLETEPEALQPRLDQLEHDGRIRYVRSKCSGSCSTCSSCPGTSGETAEPEAPPVDPAAIVISLELRKSED